jgi:hypothetical protein
MRTKMTKPTRLDAYPTPAQGNHVAKEASKLGIPMCAYVRLLIAKDMDSKRKKHQRRNAELTLNLDIPPN